MSKISWDERDEMANAAEGRTPVVKGIGVALITVVLMFSLKAITKSSWGDGEVAKTEVVKTEAPAPRSIMLDSVFGPCTVVISPEFEKHFYIDTRMRSINLISPSSLFFSTDSNEAEKRALDRKGRIQITTYNSKENWKKVETLAPVVSSSSGNSTTWTANLSSIFDYIVMEWKPD